MTTARSIILIFGVLAVVALTTGCDGGRSSTAASATVPTLPSLRIPKARPARPPATTTPTSTTPAAGTAIRHLSDFRTPSGNIGCELVAGIARCDIRKKTWQAPPKPRDCDLDYGYGLEVYGSHPAEIVCAGDTALDPGASVLQYGQDTRYGAYHCSSRADGVTCMNTKTGHGFFISYASYRLFTVSPPGRSTSAATPTSTGCRASPSEQTTCTATYSEGLTYQPAQLVLSVDGALWMGGITWTGWNSATAIGQGTAHLNSCQPSCAEGKFQLIPATLTATDRSYCDRRGVYVYTSLHIQLATNTGARDFAKTNWYENACR